MEPWMIDRLTKLVLFTACNDIKLGIVVPI